MFIELKRNCDGKYLAGQKASLTLRCVHLKSKRLSVLSCFSSKGQESFCLICWSRGIFLKWASWNTKIEMNTLNYQLLEVGSSISVVFSYLSLVFFSGRNEFWRNEFWRKVSFLDFPIEKLVLTPNLCSFCNAWFDQRQ